MRINFLFRFLNSWILESIHAFLVFNYFFPNKKKLFSYRQTLLIVSIKTKDILLKIINIFITFHGSNSFNKL